MQTSRLVELRLTAFKSFRGATLRLGDTTILTGRNSSGKSNALDGLEVLARLAGGEDVHDALDGRRREGGAVRGGSVGCAPHGESGFRLGCTVAVGPDLFHYDVALEVHPELRVIEERLRGPVYQLETRRMLDGVLFETKTGSSAPGIEVMVHNGKRGVNPSSWARDSRLVLAQIPAVVTGRNAAERSVLVGVEAVTLALRGVFHLDPVPSLMREFVPSRDVELRRDGSNLSPALCRLSSADPAAFERIRSLVRDVADERVVGLDFVSSDLGDVMVVLDEQEASRTAKTSAREMSDGLLRFLAVATALLSAQHGLDVDTQSDAHRDAGRDGSTNSGGVLIVLEEMENGLHPSQARRVLDLVRSTSTGGTSVLFTTHSPALLDAAEGVLADSVVVCHRDRGDGRSLLTPLKHLPGYAQALAEGTLGKAVTAGRLVDQGDQAPQDYSEFERLLGLT
jgi:hypothetical protein